MWMAVQEEVEQLREAVQGERRACQEAGRALGDAREEARDLARQLALAQTAAAEGEHRLDSLTAQLDAAQGARCIAPPPLPASSSTLLAPANGIAPHAPPPNLPPNARIFCACTRTRTGVTIRVVAAPRAFVATCKERHGVIACSCARLQCGGGRGGGGGGGAGGGGRGAGGCPAGPGRRPPGAAGGAAGAAGRGAGAAGRRLSLPRH